jgi:tetrahydromethanopterin S-methyltransferase subunit G
MNPGPQQQPQKDPKGSGSVFHHRQEVDPNVIAMSNEVNNINRRLRVLEERYLNLRKNAQVTDQNMITSSKRTVGKIQSTTTEMDELRRNLYEVEEKLKLILKELELCAKKADVQLLDRYISMLEPLGFVTRNDIPRLVADALASQPARPPAQAEPPARKV